MKMKMRTRMRIKKLLLVMCVCVIITAFASSCGGAGSAVPAGNINNYGYVLVDGNDIYYTKVIMTDLTYYGNIYKYNMSDKTEILVAQTELEYPNEMNAYMSVYNGELYFLPYFLNDSIKESSPNIYKVKPDGVNVVPEAMFEKDISCTFMQIEGGLIYYYDDTEEKLYSIKPNGTNKKVVCEALMLSISIGGGKAYFADYEVLRSVSLKGGNPQDIYDFMKYEEDDEGNMSGDIFYLNDIVFDGKYIYYSDDNYSRVGRIKTDGTGKEDIYIVPGDSGEYINFFNISGDNIYIVAENYGKEESYAILSVNAGAGAKSSPPNVTVIVSGAEYLGDILPVSIWGDTIYFCGMPSYSTIMESDYVWFTVKKSGGKISPFKPFSIFDEMYGTEDEESDEEDYDNDWDAEAEDGEE